MTHANQNAQLDTARCAEFGEVRHIGYRCGRAYWRKAERQMLERWEAVVPVELLADPGQMRREIVRILT